MDRERYLLDDDEQEIDLLQLLEIAKNHLMLIIAICIICASAGFAVSKTLIPKVYTAVSTVIITSSNSNTSAANATNYNDVVFSQKLANTYIQIMTSDAIGDIVDAKLNINQEDGKAYDLEVKSLNNTEVLEVSVESKDPKLSADVVNKTIGVFKDVIGSIMQIDNVTVLNRAEVPKSESGPSVIKYTALGGGAGLFISAIIVLISYLKDTKVKDEEDIKKIFDYPIIGKIPNFEVKE